MAVAIRNLTSNPIHLRMNSGTYLRLSPGAVSESVHEVEVQNNAKVEKLVTQRVIAVETEPEPERKGRGGKAEAPEAEAPDAKPKKAAK